MADQYRINEIFCSLQGEGIRAGTLNHFIRFTGCNLKCDVEPGPLSPGGFACDTEFASGRWMSINQIIDFMKELNPKCKSIIFTGGEPGLQLDDALVEELLDRGYYLAVETNGTIDLSPLGLSWITLSPKVAEHAVKQLKASELKYVRGLGQGIPKPAATADHYLISPAFEGNELDAKTLKWCIDLIKENPEWRLSVQQHKGWRVR
jgi:organic radical activating enzyme